MSAESSLPHQPAIEEELAVGANSRGVAWQWIENPGAAHQTTLLFRHQLSLAEMPESGVLRLCVNHLYRLYVNGELLGRGPVRADPRWPYYDTYDLVGKLRSGENTVVIVAHHFDWGCLPAKDEGHRAWCLYGGPGGLWAELEVDGQAVTPHIPWQVRQAPGWEDCPETISRFLGYRHRVTVSRFEAALRAANAGQDDAQWRWAVHRESPQLGRPEARPTPALVPTVREPVRIRTLSDSGEAGMRHVRAARQGLPGQPITLPADQDSWLTFDYGRAMGGFPVLDVETQAHAELDLYCVEAGQSRLTDRLCIEPGRWRYEPLDWRGGEALTLHARPRGGPLMVHGLRFTEMVYPFQTRGGFSCSDPTLTAIWQTCRQTAWAGVKDHPVDCLGREQAMWIADLAVHARSLHAAFGDVRPIEKALRQAMQVMHDDGVVPVPGPVGLGYERTAEFLPRSDQPLMLAVIMHDLYRLTGSLEPARAAMPRLQAIFEHFARYVDPRGLLMVAPPGLAALAPFGGWNPMLRRGAPTALNFAYVRSLQAACELAGATGEHALAQTWGHRAAHTREVATRLFWDSRRKLFIDGEQEGRPVEAFGSTANAWAALGGGVPAQEAGAWAEALRTDPAVMPPVTPYDATLLLEAFAMLGRELHCRNLLDGYFGSIVRASQPTLPEAWMAAEATGMRHWDDSSSCHPYGSGPTYLLQELVLGVKPLEAGFAKTLIQPRSLGLSAAQGRVPTPHGVIDIAWQRSDAAWRLQIELPDSIEAHLRLDRLGWGREHMQINGLEVWRSEPAAAYATQVERGHTDAASRHVHCRLTGGGTHDVVLETT